MKDDFIFLLIVCVISNIIVFYLGQVSGANQINDKLKRFQNEQERS
jgi:hypothetical protein